jgi:signal transduction histidine kinase/ActR/RegA family two-component response regulator
VFRLSLRASLATALVVVNVGLTAVVAVFAYRAAHDVMVDQAVRSVADVARGRERELQAFLERRQERLEAFLTSLERLCAERNPSGALGLEGQCMRAAIVGLHQSERATTTEIRYRERRRIVQGIRTSIETPFPGQLARIDARSGHGHYAMRATRGDLSVEEQFDLDDINGIFQDRAGLEVNGETFLTDSFGYRLTSEKYAAPTAFPVDMQTVRQCLKGGAQARLTTDYRGIDVISGARPSIAGGCIVANVTYDDTTLPLRRLATMMLYAAAVLGLLGGIASAIVAGLVTRPIHRLAAAARSLADGNLDAPVPVAGASEVRQLSKTLSNMATSIRDLVHREQSLRMEAEAASRTKDDFLATLSHELRTPLNAILGWASILARTDQDRARVSHAVRVIERNARVQSQMVEELLDVSRIATGRVRLNVSDVLIGPAIDAALESVRPAAEAKNVALRKEIDPAARTTRADARRLQQIIWNLLSNAVRFTPAGGHVEVNVRRSNPGFIEIIVADSGCGIDPAFLPHVFERFRQGDSSTTRTHGGLGLGLAIVHDLVGMHGGTVHADSAGIGQGTTFTVRLPAATQKNSDASVPGWKQQQARLTGANVLVVDDDPDAREVLRMILEDAGARVTTAASARETREVLAQLHPDLLIADIGMPGEDGYSLILSIRKQENGTSRVPAIALTAHTRPEDVEHALTAGFQIHLAKPVDSSRLVDSIASLVHRAS